MKINGGRILVVVVTIVVCGVICTDLYPKRELLGVYSLPLFFLSIFGFIGALVWAGGKEGEPADLMTGLRYTLIVATLALSSISLRIYVYATSKGDIELIITSERLASFALVFAVVVSILVAYLFSKNKIKGFSYVVFEMFLFIQIGCIFGLMYATHDASSLNRSLTFANERDRDIPIYQKRWEDTIDRNVFLRFEFREDGIDSLITEPDLENDIIPFVSVVDSLLNREKQRVVLLVQGHADKRKSSQFASNYELSYLRAIFLIEWLFNDCRDIIRKRPLKEPLVVDWSKTLSMVDIVPRPYGSQMNAREGYIQISALESPLYDYNVRTLWDYFYFSFYTITTTGYGDIRPLDDKAKLYVTLENIFEILFLGILLSVAVNAASKDKSSEESKP